MAVSRRLDRLFNHKLLFFCALDCSLPGKTKEASEWGEGGGGGETKRNPIKILLWNRDLTQMMTALDGGEKENACKPVIKHIVTTSSPCI